jgi:hypothetical protein
MSRLILTTFCFTLFIIFHVIGQSVEFNREIYKSRTDGSTFYDKEHFKFSKLIAKGDTIIGVNYHDSPDEDEEEEKEKNFCRISFNRGVSWEEIDLKKQLQNHGQPYRLVLRGIKFKIFKNKLILWYGLNIYESFDWKNFTRITVKIPPETSISSNLTSMMTHPYNWSEDENNIKIYEENFAFLGKSETIGSSGIIGSKSEIYISKDLINWNNIKCPEKVRVLNFTLQGEDIYIITLQNIYKSNDKGSNWKKIEKIICPYSLELMDSKNNYHMNNYSSAPSIEIFGDNMFYRFDKLHGDGFIYNLTDNSNTKIENQFCKFPQIKDDTLFLLTNTKLYFYKDVLSKIDLDLSEFENSDNFWKNNRKPRKFENIYLTNNILIFDKESSIKRKTSFKNQENDIVFNTQNVIPKKYPNLIIKDLKILDNNQVLEANEKIQISFYIKNIGKGDANDIITKISNVNAINGVVYNNPSIITVLKPTDSLRVITSINGTLNLKNGIVKLLLSFDEKNGFSPEPIEIEFETKEFIKPLIKIVDYAFITENGKIEKGLPIVLKVIIQNVGQGKAENIKINFKYPQTNLLPNSNTQVYFTELKPGESKEIIFEFITNKLYQSNTIPIEISIQEKYNSYAENKEVYALINQNSNISTIKINGNYEQENIQIIEQSLTSDVDKDIPQINKINNNRYALIIGNEDYSSRQIGLNNESNVEFAKNDAKSFYEYSLKVLGIAKENCFIVINATSGEMTQKINVITQILTKLGDRAELIFYYAGHGFPDEVTKIPYLIPVDVSVTNLQSGVKVSELYQKFTDTKAKRITVFLDACFTGGGRDQGLLSARGVKIKPKQYNLNGNIVVFTATNNEQSALPYKDKQHGIFTYYLLKKLKETNGQISYAELQNYVQEQVSIQSLKVNSKSQDPQINVSPEILDIWENWRFN